MGDKADFSKLIAPAKDRMIATIWRILRHPQDAEDAMQNALVTVWRRRSQVEAHPAPRALILRICADAAVDQFRRRRPELVGIDKLEDAIASKESTPLDRLIKEERLDIVMAAISRLSSNQSTAIVMKFMLNESHASIAGALGCTTETVREHLARGRERLGRLLRHLEPDRQSSEILTPSFRDNEK